MNWQLQYEHITGLRLEIILYIFLISTCFTTKEVGSIEKSYKKKQTQKR